MEKQSTYDQGTEADFEWRKQLRQEIQTKKLDTQNPIDPEFAEIVYKWLDNQQLIDNFENDLPTNEKLRMKVEIQEWRILVDKAMNEAIQQYNIKLRSKR